MGSSSSGTPRARTLAAALREVRAAARREDNGKPISQRYLAQRLGLAHTTVGRWESGDSVPSAEDVSAAIAVLGVTGERREQILALARDSAQSDWLASGPPGVSQQLAGVMECERTTTHVISFDPLVISGGLQTSAYARAIIGGDRGLSPAEVETRVMLRMGRRDTFTRAKPARLLALIGEPAIKGGIGGDAVMAEQLAHLLTMSKLDTITVQVVPMNAEWNPGHAGNFALYHFDGRPTIVYLEHYRTGAFLVDEEDVEAFRIAADDIRRVAMSLEESARLIADVLDAREKRT
jgi:transcriptional regulator with XRE-family HTH domain